MFALICKVCHIFFLYLKHLRSSPSRWTAASWSCGWRPSSICPGSCAGRTGWSWSTGWVRTSPLAPGWRGSEADWWERQGPTARAGTGCGRARSVGSKWIRTGWTWVRGCGSPRSTAEEDAEEEQLRHTVILHHSLPTTASCRVRLRFITVHIFYRLFIYF